MRALHKLLDQINQSICTILAELNIHGHPCQDNRGVYVDQQKIASIGLRIKKQNTYHGFSINVNTNLAAFSAIKPCGEDQVMTQVADFAHQVTM